MTIEDPEFFKFISDNGFKQRVFRTSRGKIIMDYSGPYNIRNAYRGYYFKKLYLELDFEFLTIYRGRHKILRCLLSEAPGWGNKNPVKYLDIPEDILYFIQHKEIKVIQKPKRSGRYIPKKVRVFIFELFDNKCNFCGSTNNLEIDHIFPFSKGGSSKKDNLQLLCKPCNRKKHNKVSS